MKLDIKVRGQKVNENLVEGAFLKFKKNGQ